MKGTTIGIYLVVCFGLNNAIPIPPDQLMGWLVPENCPTACPAFTIPVCGTNHVTYTNECFLKQARCKSDAELAVANQGICQ